MTFNTHRFSGISTGAMYDMTQTNDEIKDGDLFVLEDLKIVGMLHEAWPVCLHGNDPEQQLHRFVEGYKPDSKYDEAINAANLINWSLIAESKSEVGHL